MAQSPTTSVTITVEHVRFRNNPAGTVVCRRLGRYGGSMEREYDLFEHLPNGDLLWRMRGSGHENAIQQLKELAATTSNEIRVVHWPTLAIIAVMNRANEGSALRSEPIRS